MNDYSIGIDLGGTNLRFGIMDSRWELLDKVELRTRVEDGPKAVIADMVTAVRQLTDRLPQNANLRGVGIGSPGPINLRDGILGELPNFPGWERFPLRGSLQSALGIPVLLESDANAAALAEWKIGFREHSGDEDGNEIPISSMCMITLGTGVGSGLILNGTVWHGIIGMGGEIGHCSIDPNGELCPCGNRGCLELYASATGISRSARKQLPALVGAGYVSSNDQVEGITTRDLAALAQNGDTTAQTIFDHAGAALGLALTTVVNTLDLQLYVIGGGVAQAWELFAPEMFRVLQEHSFVYRLSKPSNHAYMQKDKPFITRARLGADSGLIGAALLPLL